MKKFELIMGVIAVIAIVYKLLIGQELNFLLIFSLLGLSVFYMYFSFLFFNGLSFNKIFKKKEYRNISGWRILGTIAVGFGLGITLLGILWSLMSWPFNIYYLIGVPLILIVAVITFIRNSFDSTANNFRILKRMLIVGIFGTAFWLNPNDAFSDYSDSGQMLVKEQLPVERDSLLYEP